MILRVRGLIPQCTLWNISNSSHDKILHSRKMSGKSFGILFDFDCGNHVLLREIFEEKEINFLS